MIDVIYPYIETLASWKELEYSIRSIKKNLNEPHRIWVIGQKPTGITTEVNFIPHDRVPGIRLTNCYDATSKLEVIINHPDITEEFILMYDDIYLLQSMDREQIRPLYAMADLSRIKRVENTKHQKLIWSTRDTLDKAGVETIYNCETHLPRLFSKEKMKVIFEKFAPKENRLLTGTLYNNYFKEDRLPRVLKYTPGIAAYFYGMDKLPYSYLTNHPDEIEMIFKNHLFLNHNDAGLTKTLQSAITKQF